MSDKITQIRTSEPRFTLIEIEELAAQAWAVIDAKWRRPNRSEKEQILQAMKGQLPMEDKS